MGMLDYRQFNFCSNHWMRFDANNQAQNRFKNGLKVGGFLETGEQTLTGEQRARMQQPLGGVQ
jgi:7-keto-8-aminopelargonate synthetase-like enzyme